MLKRLHFVLSLLVAASMLLVPIVTAQDATPIVGDGEASEQITVDQDAGDTGGDDGAESQSSGEGSDLQEDGDSDFVPTESPTPEDAPDSTLSNPSDQSVSGDKSGSDTRDSSNPGSGAEIRALGVNDQSAQERISISGVVLSQAGDPIANASLCAQYYSSSDTYCGITDSTGYYLIANVPNADGYIMAKTNGFWEAFESLSVSEGDITVNFELEVISYFTIYGTVTDDLGAPIAGARVCYLVQHFGSFSDCVESSEDGTFVIEDVPNGRGGVWAEKPGYETYEISFNTPGEDLPFNPVLVGVTYITVRGKVTDEIGDPLVGAEICVITFGVGSGDFCGLTGDDGRYEISDVPNSDANVYSRKEGYFNGATQSFYWPGEDVTIDFVMETMRFITISGQVTNEDGVPLSDVRVCVSSGYGFYECSITVGDGLYAIDDVPNDWGYIRTLRTGYWRYGLDLRFPNENVTVDIVLASVGDEAFELTGTVFDDFGVKLVGASVCLDLFEVDGESLCVQTDTDGLYRFGEVPNGEHGITFTMESVPGQWAYWGLSTTLTIRDQNTRYDRELERRPTSSVAGQITDTAGSPISAASICFWAWSSSGSSQWKCVDTDDNGNFAILHDWFVGWNEWFTISADDCDDLQREIVFDSVGVNDLGTVQLRCGPIPTGEVTFALHPDNNTQDSVSITLERKDGLYVYIDLGSENPSSTQQIPEGDYTWTARSSSKFVSQSGAFTVAEGGSIAITLDSWVLHPELTITVTNQDDEPASNVYVYVYRTDDNEWAYGSGYTDDHGVLKLNVPYGNYEVNVSAPAKYAEKASFNDVFSVDRTSWDVQLEELPNGTLNVDVSGSPDRAQYVWLQVLDADDRQLAYESQYIYGTQSLAFPDLPYGEGYTITVDGTFWSKPYVSDPFDFDGSTPTQIVSFELYETVTVDVIMRSDQPGRALPQSTGLRFSTDNGSTTVYMETADDGTLRGTATVPKRQMTVQFDYDRGIYFGGDLPMDVDFSSDTAPSLLEIKVSMADFGLVTVDVFAPDGVMVQGEILVKKDGEYYASRGIYQSGPLTLSDIFYPGEYTWEYLPAGPFQAQNGSFTITNKDITVPLDLKVGANGVVLLHVSFPEGVDYPQGQAVLLNDDDVSVAARWLSGPGTFALGPVLYGTYTLNIYPYDASLLLQTIELTINQYTVEQTVAFQQMPVKTVEFNVSAAGDPPVYGSIEIWSTDRYLGSKSFEGEGVVSVQAGLDGSTPYRYAVTTANYEQIEGIWDGQAESIDIVLEDARPSNWVRVVDVNNAPIDSVYLSAQCWASTSSAQNGMWLVVPQEDVDSCKLSANTNSGLYVAQEVELDRASTFDDPQIIVLEREAGLVENIAFTVTYEGGLPEGEIRLILFTSDPYREISVLLSGEGTAVIPLMAPGEYWINVWVLGSTSSVHEMKTPESGKASVTTSGQLVDISMAKLPTGTVTVNVTDQDGAPITTGEVRFSQGKGGEFGPYPITNGVATVDLPINWSFSVSATSGLYREAYQQVTVVQGTTDVSLVLERIATIPWPGQPPVETPTATAPVETPTATVPVETPTATTPVETPTATVPVETPTTPATVTPTTTVPATETPTETVTPTEVPTQTPTEEPEGEQQLIVHITVPGDADISGAPFELWAPTAATFQVGPLYTGVVGANNTIVIDGLIPGKYRLVVYPEGMDAIEAMIQVGIAPVTEVLVEVNEEGEVAVTYLETATPTASPTDPAPTSTTEADDVTSLPSTGTGQSGNHLAPVLAMLAAAAVLGMIIPVGVKRSVRRR